VNTTKSCPGCGLTLPNQNREAPDRYNASGECRELYHELTAYFMTNPDIHFRAQHAVDAYGAQHSGGATKPITTAFSLVGLYLALERGYTGRQVQRAHQQLAKLNLTWPAFELPSVRYEITVADVLAAEDDPSRHEKLMEWAKCAWDAWRHQQEWTRSICSQCGL